MSDLIELSQRVRNIEHWKNGDGAIGAERRLQITEQLVQQIGHKCNSELNQDNAQSLEDLKGQIIQLEHRQEDMMTQENMTAMGEKLKGDIVLAIRAEKKKGIEKVKAWAPYFVSLCTLATAILVAILRH